MQIENFSELCLFTLQTPKPPERMFKVILVGDTSVGKSSFMHQFCDGVFYPKLRATVGEFESLSPYLSQMFSWLDFVPV